MPTLLLSANKQDLGDSPPSPRLGDGCVPQTPSKINFSFFSDHLLVLLQFSFLTAFFISIKYIPLAPINLYCTKPKNAVSEPYWVKSFSRRQRLAIWQKIKGKLFYLLSFAFFFIFEVRMQWFDYAHQPVRLRGNRAKRCTELVEVSRFTNRSNCRDVVYKVSTNLGLKFSRNCLYKSKKPQFIINFIQWQVEITLLTHKFFFNPLLPPNTYVFSI